MTYPAPEVGEFLGSAFLTVRFGMTDKAPETRSLVRRYRLLWSPGFVVLDPRGEEVRRFIGFQFPRDFIAELRIALGKVWLLHRKPAEAYEQFRRVGDLEPAAPVSPEGVYWAGIAAQRRDDRNLDFLREYWTELERRFPRSRWWTHANVFGDEP